MGRRGAQDRRFQIRWEESFGVCDSGEAGVWPGARGRGRAAAACSVGSARRVLWRLVPACLQCACEFQRPARFCGQCGVSLPEEEVGDVQDAWLGRVIDRRYRVLSRIGSGGMGLVYRVEHIQLGKVAAMKVLHADTARDSEAVRRFRTEAQAVSRLSHPNIVQTFDFGQSEGALYLIMEYVKGDDLATVVQREGPLSFERAAPLFVQICSALTEAHDSGVIHRDLKPENIVVVTRREGAAHAKVLDFGLAKLRERSDGADITSGGQVIGTPYYMSPEQVRSESLDVRTDIYSLGATLYRVLTGTPPFQAPTPVGVLTMHITDPLELPRVRAPGLNLPREADAIVCRAMAKAREDRYSSAAEVQHALEAAIAGLRGAVTRESATNAAETARLERDNQPLRPGPTQWERHERFSEPASTLSGNTDLRAEANDGDDFHSDGDSDSTGVDGRLRRKEFDAFERSLRRRKVLASLVVPILLAIAAGVGIWAFGRTHEQASSVEREPNNAAREATLLPLDTPVQGTVGRRQSEGQPDMDYFRVPMGRGARMVSARVEGIPDVDLVLELFDAQGLALGKSDSHGTGGGEWLQPVMIGPAEAYLLVRQVWIQGTAPMEEVASPYRLVVHWEQPISGWEMEPNDWPERATAVEVGRSVKGYLGSAEDRDWFAFAAAHNGDVVGRITPPEGVEMVVTTGDGSKSDRVISGKADRSGEIRIRVKAGQRTLVGFARKPTGGGNARSATLVGLDHPYELNLDLRISP